MKVEHSSNNTIHSKVSEHPSGMLLGVEQRSELTDSLPDHLAKVSYSLGNVSLRIIEINSTRCLEHFQIIIKAKNVVEKNQISM